MNKSELVSQIAAQAGTSSTDVERVLNSFRDVVQTKVKAGEDISYPGLGKFSRVARKARTGRNPQTGEAIQIQASYGVKISAGSKLKAAAKS